MTRRNQHYPSELRERAVRMVFEVTCRCRMPTSPGCSGLPEQFSALSESP